MGRVEGKVAFITGAARGQGRAHAIRMAEEGADIIAVDVCSKMVANHPSSAVCTPEDLAVTVKEVEALGRRIIASETDVRDFAALKDVLDGGVAELGRLDIVVANAGVCRYERADVVSEEIWQETIDVNLTGVWHTTKAATPHLIASGGGAMILTSSLAGFKGFQNLAHYVAAKHGVLGLMKTLANELGQYSIRVNTIHPGTVDTDLVHCADTYAIFAPDLENPTRDDVIDRFRTISVLPEPWMAPREIANAALFLASDEARFITGAAIPVDLGGSVI